MPGLGYMGVFPKLGGYLNGIIGVLQGFIGFGDYDGLGFPKIRGYLFGDPYNKDYSILGSIMGNPNVGNCHIGYGV